MRWGAPIDKCGNVNVISVAQQFTSIAQSVLGLVDLPQAGNNLWVINPHTGTGDFNNVSQVGTDNVRVNVKPDTLEALEGKHSTRMRESVARSSRHKTSPYQLLDLTNTILNV